MSTLEAHPAPGMAVENEISRSDEPDDASPWIAAESRKQARKKHQRKNVNYHQAVSSNLDPHRPRLSRDLRGAQKATVEVFHLSGIDLDCTADDVLMYYREKGVLTTACYLLPRRVRHSTQIAMLFTGSTLRCRSASRGQSHGVSHTGDVEVECGADPLCSGAKAGIEAAVSCHEGHF